MHDIAESFRLAFALVVALDADLVEIVGLSLKVSLSAVLLSVVVGFPLGAALAVVRFPGRGAVVVVVNTLMGLPPVVVGLLVYLMLSNAGPFGWLQLLYSPAAMIIAQTILITPIVTALTREIVARFHDEYAEFLASLCLSPAAALGVLLWDARFGLVTVALAGFGRAVAEVGAVIVVGGNINHLTRVMTTAIALETSRGDLPLALALGVVLMVISLGVNALVMALRSTMHASAYA